MSELFLRAGDTISGQEGKAQAIINGSVENLFMIKTLEASIEKKKEPVNTLGHRGEQHKGAGWSGSGDMTIYYVSSLFRRLMLKYIKEGIDTYFTIIITNEDPSSTIGRQTIALHNCNLDSAVAAALDVDATTMEEDVSFTFDDIDILEEFDLPENLR